MLGNFSSGSSTSSRKRLAPTITTSIAGTATSAVSHMRQKHGAGKGPVAVAGVQHSNALHYQTTRNEVTLHEGDDVVVHWEHVDAKSDAARAHDDRAHVSSTFQTEHGDETTRNNSLRTSKPLPGDINASEPSATAADEAEILADRE